MNSNQRIQAAAAFQAYNAMETTKQRHLDLMLAIDKRAKKFNLPATDTENVMLQALLEDHNEQVQQFKLESDTLKSTHPETHVAMFQYLAEIHHMLDAFKASNTDQSH